MYDPTCSFRFHYQKTPLGVRTRGNKQAYILTQHHCHYDLRKYTYVNRLIPIWDNLSDYDYVVSAEMVKTFKQCLDKFWSDQDVLYIKGVTFPLPDFCILFKQIRTSPILLTSASQLAEPIYHLKHRTDRQPLLPHQQLRTCLHDKRGTNLVELVR